MGVLQSCLPVVASRARTSPSEPKTNTLPSPTAPVWLLKPSLWPGRFSPADGQRVRQTILPVAAICLTAIKKNGFALQYVKNQTFQFVLESEIMNDKK